MFYYLKKNWKATLWVCFLHIALWGVQAAMQLLLMKSFDAVFRLDFQNFLFWSLMNIAGWGMYFLLGTVQGYAQAHAIRKMNNQVRQDLYLSLLSKDHLAYHSRGIGEYVSWLTNNVNKIESLAWEPFFEYIGRIAQVIWSIFALVTLNWTLLVAALISAVVMWFIPRLFENKMKQLGDDCSQQQALAVSRMKDLLSGLDVLRLFGHNDHFLHQGYEVSDQIEKPSFYLSFVQNSSNCIVGFFSVLMQFLADILIAVLAFQGTIALGTLGGGSNLIAGITNGLSSAASQRLSMIAATPYFKHITTHTGQHSTTIPPECTPVKESITVNDVSFFYSDKPVLQKLSLRFEIGGKYAITGPSGCGKSSFLKLLLGWLPDYTGTIFFDNRNARSFTPEQLQKQMSYIEQNVFLFNTTIRENITLGDEVSQEKLEKAIRNSALEEDLANMPLGLDTPVGEDGSNLSGGQRQRVAIARALIHNRSILLVDEGTSALDPKNADIVEKSLLNNSDLTLILVSHHLSPERKLQFNHVFEMGHVADQEN